MPRLADMRARLNAYFGGGEYGHLDQIVASCTFTAHAPEDMCALLDAWDFVVDGRLIRYVVAQLDAASQELALAGDHGMAQVLSRLAVMLERLG